MPARNKDLEYSIMVTINQSSEPLTSREIAEILKPEYSQRYCSFISFKNMVIKKLKWLCRRRILTLDGERYSHSQKWSMGDFGKIFLDHRIRMKQLEISRSRAIY
jgi:hypothetical protein